MISPMGHDVTVSKQNQSACQESWPGHTWHNTTLFYNLYSNDQTVNA